ncbi:MAG TPA: DUF2382 domain-containing protein [Thermomicrobiales bacterium]|nr:DUF2382 domain-containing protein [Thermomicrobiales bacterium]
MALQDWQSTITDGMSVYGSDGDKVGTIVSVGPSYVVVEKGFFFPTDYYIPFSAIASQSENGVYLDVTKEAALNQGWDVAPTAATTFATDTGVGAADNVAAAPAAGWTGAASNRPLGTDTVLDEGETVVVPVFEEELTATKTPYERGEVRIEKDVVTEERVLDVPVTEEEVHVQRRAVDRPIEAPERAFEERVIEVPLRGEDVELQKRVRVAEEVEISKEPVQRTERVTGKVRREEVHVEETDVENPEIAGRPLRDEETETRM